MVIKNRIKAAWDVLTKKCVIVHASNSDIKYMIKDSIMMESAKLLLGKSLSLERYQMLSSVLYDRSVILQSMCWQKDGKAAPTVIYDCKSEEDFNELREQEIE